MFRKLFEQQDEIPDYQMYMADGFRENHFYSEEGEIETRKISEHRGILLMFNFPESVEFEINEEKLALMDAIVAESNAYSEYTGRRSFIERMSNQQPGIL